ncbi:MAG: cupin domain-containing protein [Ferruginibacter sp.]
METEHELNDKIMSITMQIQEKYPELLKYLNEMPVTIPDENKPEINTSVLKNYYESLKNILKDYVAEHAGTLPSHPRPDPGRLLEAPMLNFDLPAAIERIKKEEEWISGKHNAITLMKSASMRIVVIAMHQGNEMKMHQSDGPITVHIIEGKLNFITENESVILQKGQLVTLQENIKHGLIAIEETVFLLTMVNL